ncbi:putative polyprotein [Hordeum vulgare]|nr:putative polyprotein [Hordeum vulgare]
MLCTPIICDVAVSKTLINGGASLNVISVEAFDARQLTQERLAPSKPFSGVVAGSVTHVGRIRLPVTSVTDSNFLTEQIDFDVAHIHLPYNAILGYPAHAQFMAATHPRDNVVKMPGSDIVLTIVGDVKDAFRGQK